MAWIRTCLSLISFGIGIEKLVQYLAETQPGRNIDPANAERVLGMSFTLLASLAMCAAAYSHWQILRRIERRDFQYTSHGSPGIVVGISLIVIGLLAFIAAVLK